MKLKKTLSMLIGGICLVAATTVALAGPVVKCDICGGDAPATYSTVYKGMSHEYKLGHRVYTCKYTAKCRRETYKCLNCGRTLFYKDTTISELYHDCGL